MELNQVTKLSQFKVKAKSSNNSSVQYEITFPNVASFSFIEDKVSSTVNQIKVLSLK